MISTVEPFGGRRQPRIDAGDRETIRLAAPVRRGVGRALRQRTQLLGDVGEMRRDRQLGSRAHAARPDRTAAPGSTAACSVPRMHVGGDEGIAVAVAADPASHAQERGELARRRFADLLEPVFQRADQPRHLAQEGVIVERQAVGDLVEHGELGPAQQIGLPQRQHRAAQLLVACCGLLRASAARARGGRAGCDLHLAVHGALAADLGRMRGQHRADQRGLEEAAQLGRCRCRPPCACASVSASTPERRAAGAARRASGGCCSGPRRCWRGGRNS